MEGGEYSGGSGGGIYWTTRVATIGLQGREEHLGEVESPVEMFECDLKRLSVLKEDYILIY